MMDLLINERSFQAQGRNRQHGIELMDALISLVTSFKKLPKANRIFTHSSFHDLILSNEYRVLDCLKNLSSTTARQVFFQLATKGPFIDHILQANIPNHTCSLDREDVKDSSLAGAAYLRGCLASLNESLQFNTPLLTVMFSDDGVAPALAELKNFVNAESMTQQLRLRYAASPKHAAGGFGTFMNLSDDLAEDVLNRGILGPNGRQVYCCHDGQLYEFQPDGTGTFHGYPVPSGQVPMQALRNMVETGMIDSAEYKRFLRDMSEET